MGMAQKSAPAIDEASLEEIVRALTAACEGDFSVRLPARRRDVVGELQGRVNELVGQNRRMAKELARVARVIGRDGRMTERAVLPGLYGEWAESIESGNALIDDLVRPTTEVARVITAGDGRGQGRGRGAGAHDQRDGRPALELRRRGDPSRARGGDRGRARGPGAGRR